ncbi:MAG: 50S ribosomal protein L19 [Elusimicrobia bacterium]|nr:50S ribosomal protein L19 [Elusimicrobiota bacterium]
MSKKIIEELEKTLTPKKEMPEFWPGDEITVYVKLKEGEKERLQAFTGTCIARKGSGTRESITVRKISYGEGVERTFALHSPVVSKIEVVKTREKNKLSPRAKMYYLKRKGR